MSRYTSGRFGALPALSLPILLLDLVAWIILLAGVSALQKQCKSQGEVVSDAGSVLAATSCRHVYRFQWWTVILQLIILLIALGTVAMGFLSHHRIALSSLLAIVTVLLMYDTNTFLFAHDVLAHGSLWRRSNTYFAGAIMSSLLNFLLLLTLGHSGESYGNREAHVPPHTHAGAHVPGTGAHAPGTGAHVPGTGPHVPTTGTTTGNPGIGSKGPMGTTANEPVSAV